MNSRKKFFIPLLLIAGLLTGCGIFSANPLIDSFTASKTTIDPGGSVTFTVKGSTKDPNMESDLVDYSGTITITSAPAGISEVISISELEATGFAATKTIRFPDAGTYTLTALLVSGDKTATSKSLTITVNKPLPWDGEYVHDLTTGNNWILGYSILDAGGIIWHRFKAVDPLHYIHWQDRYDKIDGDFPAADCDISVTVYDKEGKILKGPQDYGCWETGGSYRDCGSVDGIKVSEGIDYTFGDWVYLKVDGYGSSTGHYKPFVF